MYVYIIDQQLNRSIITKQKFLTHFQTSLSLTVVELYRTLLSHLQLFPPELYFTDKVWYGMVWYGMVWYMAWYGMVWYGMVWYGMVWYGMYDRVWYGMV